MKEFDELVEIMARLRAPDGCPWDRQQHTEDLKKYLLEEAYEVVEAADGADPSKLCAELGDLTLVIVFFAQVASEAGEFDISQSLARINEKLRYRHPHVFGDTVVSGADEVLSNWEHLKRTEPEVQHRTSALDGVPRAMPALQRAFGLQKRAARVGFDWDAPEGARDKVSEELEELGQAVAENDREAMSDELGDLLFAVVNYGRLLKIDSEDALRQAAARFEERFRALEEKVAGAGRSLEQMTLGEMDEVWEAVKAESGRERA